MDEEELGRGDPGDSSDGLRRGQREDAEVVPDLAAETTEVAGGERSARRRRGLTWSGHGRDSLSSCSSSPCLDAIVPQVVI
jgi:hypothetical protein